MAPPLSAGSGAGGTSQSNNFALVYPGDGPVVPTNAVTVNLLYSNNAQFVRWSLQQENPGLKGDWFTLFQSPRGINYKLATQTFSGLPPGWYRFHLEDPRASPSMRAQDYSIQWMSLMAPRGQEVWGMNAGFTAVRYDVYFEINTIGVPSLGSRSSAGAAP